MPVPMLPPTLSAAAASDVRSPMEIQSFSYQGQTGVGRVDMHRHSSCDLNHDPNVDSGYGSYFIT